MNALNGLTNEKGSMLVLAVLVISLLGLIALWSSQTSTTETRIANNDKLAKAACYEAEGATEVSSEIITSTNFWERGTGANGDDAPILGSMANTLPSGERNLLTRDKSNFHDPVDALNRPLRDDDGKRILTKPNYVDNKDCYLPFNHPTPPTNSITVGSEPDWTRSGTGGAAVSGSEGLGKGSAGAGVARFVNVRSRHQGADNKDCTISILYRKVL